MYIFCLIGYVIAIERLYEKKMHCKLTICAVKIWKKGKQIYMHTDCDRAKKVNADMPKCTM